MPYPYKHRLIRYIIWGTILAILLSSCGRRSVPNISCPSKRDIRRAMRWSTSDYAPPVPYTERYTPVRYSGVTGYKYIKH